MKNLIIATLSLVLLASCNQKSDAVTATDAQDAAQTSAEAKNYMVDSLTSVVNWRGYKIYEGKTEEEGHNGFFKLTSGTVAAKAGKLESGEFVIDINSVTATDDDYDNLEEGRAKLAGHLKTADFLDAENHPTAKFVITEVAAPEADKADQYNTLIKGNLTLRGVEKNIPFHANVEVNEDGVKIFSEDFTINRKDFGSEYSMKGGLLKNDVGVQIDVKATNLSTQEETTETAE